MALSFFTMMIMLALTLLILLTGIGFMVRGGELNKKYGNKLMIARVSAQAGVVILLGILFVMGR